MGRKRTIPLHERDKKSISVTYSKRRKTLFTKAAETALEYQIPIAVLVSSAGQRQRSKFCGFGNPSVDDVLNSYLGCGSKGAMKIDDRAKALWEEVNELEVEVKNMRDREKKGEGSDGGDDQWWLRDIESMGLDELCEFANRLEKLKEDVRVRLESDSNTSDFSGMVDDGDAKNENMDEVMDWIDFSGMVDDGDAKNENMEEVMDWIDFSGMVDDGDAKNENMEEAMDWYWKPLLT